VNGLQPEEPALSRPTGPRPRAVRRAALASIVVTLSVLLGACASGDGVFDLEAAGDEQPADVRYVIPEGTGAANDAGQPVEIMPARLEVSVGQVIEIVNEDDRGHLVGPFFVGAGETLRQRFSSPGTFIGACTINPDGEIAVIVS
jgi:plastocyanin